MSNIKLYECTADVLAVLDHHFDSDTEAADTLEAVIGQFEAKAQSVAAYILNREAEIGLLEEHIKTMQGKLKTLKNRNGSLKEYMHRQMTAAGITEIKADNGTFSAKVVKNPPSVDVYDMTLLDPAYIREKISYEPDKTAIKTALQNGENIQGARLVKDKTSLRIS